MGKIRALAELLTRRGPDRKVSKRWLLQTSSRFDQRFVKSAKYSVGQLGDYIEVRIEGQRFLWPSSARFAMILQVMSELLNPNHPHQYIYGRTQVCPEDVVLDIGACEGSFAALMTSRCRQVIAVEPSRNMCALIAKLFDIRQEQPPILLNCLLGDESSTAYFLEDPSNPGGSRITPELAPGAYPVPVRTLDEVVETLKVKPTFIKCDAEGFEPRIFAGGRTFLTKHRPKLAITTYHNVSDYAEMYTLLKSMGYNVAGKGYFYTDGTLRVQMIHAW
jgi:FkbM family methyltransferase